MLPGISMWLSVSHEKTPQDIVFSSFVHEPAGIMNVSIHETEDEAIKVSPEGLRGEPIDGIAFDS